MPFYSQPEFERTPDHMSSSESKTITNIPIRWTEAIQSLNDYQAKNSPKMVSLIADYEQQYSALTAEITAEIGKLGRSEPGNYIRSLRRHGENQPS